MATVSAVAEVVNHFADYEQDKAQKEKRLGPILLAGGSSAGGRLFTGVRAISVFLIIAGVIYFATAIALARWNFLYLGVATLAFLMAVFYSLKPIRLKERGFWGILDIAVGRGLVSFHLGWLVVNTVTADSLLVGLIISLVVFGSAITAHLCDYEEDKAAGIMTFPVRVGLLTAHTVSYCALMLAWMLIMTLSFAGFFPIRLAAMSMWGVEVGVGFSAIFITLWWWLGSLTYGLTTRYFKTCQVISLMTVLVVPFTLL